MRTVRWLKEELAKFPDDAECFAYCGEVTGLIINPPQGCLTHTQGVIHCSEYDDDRETELIRPVAR